MMPGPPPEVTTKRWRRPGSDMAQLEIMPARVRASS